MKLWLDDDTESPSRKAPPGWLWATNSVDAIEMIKNNHITEISFDHDSGDGDDFIRVANFLEERACLHEYHQVKWSIHSANPAGAKAIKAAMESADRFWEAHLAKQDAKYLEELP